MVLRPQDAVTGFDGILADASQLQRQVKTCNGRIYCVS